MGKQFSVNATRSDPYKTYRFRVYFGTSTDPILGVSKVGGLKRSSDPIEYKEGGNPVILKGLGRTKFEPITLERGVTHDPDFEDWADSSDTRGNRTSLANLRRDLRIELMNEAGQPVLSYFVYRCWVSEYQPLPDLDAGSNAVAIEHIKIEHEGWKRDTQVKEPKEL